MCEKMVEEKVEKIKASSADIIVEKIDGRPYYSIKYFDLSENQGYIGFGSYNLEFVFEWKEKYFEIVDRVDKSKNDNGDLISRKALMEEIGSLQMNITGLRAGKSVLQNYMEEYRKSVLKCIDDAPEVYDVDAVQFYLQNLWISCIERMPEERQEVWITTKKGNVRRGMYTKHFSSEHKEGFLCSDGFMLINMAAYWMPYYVPKPYIENTEKVDQKNGKKGIVQKQ